MRIYLVIQVRPGHVERIGPLTSVDRVVPALSFYAVEGVSSWRIVNFDTARVAGPFLY